MYRRDFGWTVLVGAVCLIAGFLAGAMVGTSVSQGEDPYDRRFHECMEAGGSFSKGDTDWSCTHEPK